MILKSSILLFCLTILGHAEDLKPQVVLEEARAAYARKDYAVAMEKAAWFWDNAERLDPACAGLKRSDVRNLLFSLQKESPEWHAAYLKKMDDALAAALADTSDPAKQADAKPPANHLAFLDYLALADKVQTDKEITDHFKQLQTVNPALASWGYGAVAEHLLKEKEYRFMNGFVPPWNEQEKGFISLLLIDYRFARERKIPSADQLDYLLSKLRVIRIVYEKNDRTADAKDLSFFCQMYLTDSEKAGLEPVKDNF